uniref:Bradykinin receptor B1 n=1 Tax=Astyanax mexicanus TaxID=7994 RepID=W5LUW3_ASTMX
MDQTELVTVASLTTHLDNITNSASSSLMMFNSSDWKLVHAIVPPYIFVLCLTGILGNAFVLLVFFLQRTHWTVPEIYLGNLALADLILLSSLPFWAMNILNYFNWPYGEFLCKVVNVAIVVNMYASIYMLVMVNIDRYLALVLTMKARWLRRRRNAKIITFWLWILGVAMGIPTLTYRTVKTTPELPYPACLIEYPEDSHRLAHSLQMNILGFALPLLAIVFCSYNILHALWKRMENLNMHNGNDRKATLLVCAVTLLFFVCWGPFQIVTFLDMLCDLHFLDKKWYHTLDIAHQFSTYFAFLNSCFNPLLYVCTGHYFRRKVSDIYKRRRSSVASVITTLQRSAVSTYTQRTDQIKPVVL